MRIEIRVTDPAKQIGDSQTLSGYDASLGSFFQHHKTNEALKYSAIFQENDVNVGPIFYIFWIPVPGPIDLDELATCLHSPLH